MTHSLTEEDISEISDAIIDKFYAKSIFLYFDPTYRKVFFIRGWQYFKEDD
jgi:hypothetical protein